MIIKKKSKLIKIALIALLIAAAVFYLVAANGNKHAEKNKTEIKKTSVTVTSPVKKTVSENLTISGAIKAYNDVQVVSETQGKVLSVFMNIGDYVQQGKILAETDGELKNASFLSAKTNYEKAQKDYERYQNLLKGNYVSEDEVENAKISLASAEAQFITAGRELSNTKIKAPISGIISDKNIDVGSYVSNGTVAANIVDISKLKMKVNVGEKYILKIRKGSTVSITTDLYPGFSFNGTVYGISPKGTESITYPVEIILYNSKNKPLNDGMSAKANFSFGKKEINSIPRAALVSSYQDPKVYVIEGNTAKLKTIVIGDEYDTDIEVIKGLSSSDKVVVNGQNNLSENAEVEIQQ